jgi:predicted metal-dependent hydrolase
MDENILTYVVLVIVIIGCLYVYFENNDFDLKCIVSGVDGNKYCVRERSKLKEASNLLATVTKKCKDLVAYTDEHHGSKENVKRLVKGFDQTVIKETLPTSKFTAYSENKGEKLAFCLNKKKQNNENLIDEHTLMFVAIHELAHIMTLSIGHKTEFWDNFKFLLENAKEAGIHQPVDYSEKPQEYCGMTISDSPYYDQ